MKKTKILSTLILVFMVLFFTQITRAYWTNSINTVQINSQATVSIGTWTFIEPFDPQEDYDTDDTFVYDNRVWIVTGSWFNGSNFLNPDGTVNTTYVKPYGPIQEVTDEWRIYNTYGQNDIVLHNGYQWIVRHEGANGVEPGSNTNAWNRLGSDWFIYNTYPAGSVVTYNGQNWVSLTENRGRVPGQVPWAWQLQ